MTQVTRTLTLARDTRKNPLWKSYEVATDGGDHDKPIWSQQNWSGGLGEGVFSSPTKYAWGSSVDTSSGYIHLGPALLPGLTSTGAAIAGSPTDYEFHVSTWWMATDNGSVYEWSDSKSWWILRHTQPVAGATYLTSHDARMYVSNGGTYYSGGGTTWVASTTVDGNGDSSITSAVKMLSAPSYAGVTSILWKAIGNKIYNATRGTNDYEWSTPITVGGINDNIIRLFAHQGMIYIGKHDGLYYYDSDGKVHKLLDVLLSGGYQSNNFQHIVTLKGATYFSLGMQIGELTTYNSFDTIEPLKNVTNIDFNEASCCGLASDGTNLYASFYDGLTTNIYKGTQLTDAEGNTTWSWCLFITHGSEGCAMGVEPPAFGVMHPKLFYGYAAHSYYSLLARNPTASSFYYKDTPTFHTSGGVETGWIDLGAYDWDKVIDSITVECKMSSGDMSATKYVQVAYATENEASWLDIDTGITTAGSCIRKYVDTAPFVRKKFRFRIMLYTDDATVTPIVKSLSVYGTVRQPRVPLFDFTVYAETGRGGQQAKAMRDFLLTARDTNGLLTLTDLYGESHPVRILAGYPIESASVEQGGISGTPQPAVLMRVVCQEVDWS
jgi:hypothetical protein